MNEITLRARGKPNQEPVDRVMWFILVFQWLICLLLGTTSQALKEFDAHFSSFSFLSKRSTSMLPVTKESEYEKQRRLRIAENQALIASLFPKDILPSSQECSLKPSSKNSHVKGR